MDNLERIPLDGLPQISLCLYDTIRVRIRVVVPIRDRITSMMTALVSAEEEVLSLPPAAVAPGFGVVLSASIEFGGRELCLEPPPLLANICVSCRYIPQEL